MDVDMTLADAPMASPQPKAASSTDSQLLRLPLELLLRVSFHLTTTELCSLRLTCGQIEQALFDSFAREYFRFKQFNLTEFSLRALVAISKSRLAGSLRHLQLRIETIGHARSCHNHRSLVSAFLHNQLHTQQWHLAATGQDVALLAEAMRGLTNLEDVVVRDTNSSRRSRDGPRAQWRSYGDPTFQRHTGAVLTQGAAGDAEFMGYAVFFKALQAMAASESKADGVELLLRNQGLPWQGTFYVPDYLKETMVPMLGRLRKLHLTLAGEHRSQNRGEDPFSDLTWSFDLRQFLSYTVNLEDLRFNGTWPDTAVADRFLEWLALEEGAAVPCPESFAEESLERSIVDNSPKPVALAKLKTFSLGRTSLQPGTLERLMRKHVATMQDLSLWDLTIHVPDDAAGDPHDNDEEDEEKNKEWIVWQKLCRGLAGIEGLELRHVKMGRLRFRQSKEQHWHWPASMKFLDGRGEVEYTGPSWRVWVKEQLLTANVAKFGKFYRQRELEFSLMRLCSV